MRTFEYKGFSPSGQSERGLVEALDIKDAREKLARKGILAETVGPAGTSKRLAWRRSDVLFALDARAAVYRELASILKAGLPLTQALTLLMEAPELGRNRTIIASLRNLLGEGVAFAEALKQVAPSVTSFERAMVRTGEQTGRLAEVLDRVAEFLEEEQTIRDRVVSALIYPVIIIVLSGVVAIALLVFLLPGFRELLEDSGIGMPWITRAVMWTGQTIIWGVPLLILLIGIGLYGIRKKWQESVAFRCRLDRGFHRAPLVRSFYSVLVHVRFTRTLALLLENNVSILDALQQAAAAGGSPWVQQLIEREVEAVRHGAPLSDAIARVPPLASTLPGWIRAGEASGDLVGMLGHAAARTQQQWERRLTRTMSVVESGLVILVGALVFLLALSIILPIMSINQTLQ